jgi:hypothetical protein
LVLLLDFLTWQSRKMWFFGLFLSFKATWTDGNVTWRVESSTLHSRWPTRRKIVTITVKYIFFSGFKRCSRHAVRHKYDGAPTYGERRSIKHQLIWRAVVVTDSMSFLYDFFF